MSDWEYSWKSSDGVRHEGVMAASCKDEVYTKLKAQGIRAIRVSERIVVKGGVKSLRKRDWFAIAALLAVTAVVGAMVPVPWRGTVANPRDRAKAETESPAERRPRSLPRRQLESCPDAGKVFSHPAEVFLAAFAVPGDVKRLPSLTDEIAADFFNAFDDEIILSVSDSKPVAELKRVVIGLKQEAETFLESGKSAEELAKWLVSRQRMEARYRLQIMADVEKGILSEADAETALKEAGLDGVKKMSTPPCKDEANLLK